MTQASLPFDKSHRSRLTDRVRAYFTAHPNVWLDAREFMTIGGFAGWRTRISEVRQGGMAIENRTRRQSGYTVSEYRYVPGQTQERVA